MRDLSGAATPGGVPERLVQATIRLLAEQGPSAIKARTVASAAGLSTMVVYSHFGGIPELTRAVIDQGFKELDAAFRDLPVGRPREPPPLRPDVRSVDTGKLSATTDRIRLCEWTFTRVLGRLHSR